jgi:hypothetical protein
MPLQRDLDEAQHIKAQRLPVNQSDVMSDDAGVFQLAQPLLQSRRGKVQAAGQFGVAQPGISLNVAKQGLVDLIKVVCHAHPSFAAQKQTSFAFKNTYAQARFDDSI